MNNRYNSINPWLRQHFGRKVFKVSLESGCGCPNKDSALGKNGCVYCRLDSCHPATSFKSDGVSQSDGAKKKIREQLNEGIQYTRKRHKAELFIGYFQSGSNTHASAHVLEPMFFEAIDHPNVVGLAISTRPDCIGKDHIKLFRGLKKKTMLWVELGLQSAHNTTLTEIKRGHTAADFETACIMLKSIHVPICAHVILGLPGETPSMMVDTAHFLNRLNIWGVKIHNLHILKGTELETKFLNGEISLPSLQEYSSWVTDFLEELNPNILIHRVNSHSPRHLTIAPDWSINKLAIFNAVEKELEQKNSWQGKRYKNSNPATHPTGATSRIFNL